METYRNEYQGLMIVEDGSTSILGLLERLADGEGLECRIISSWERFGFVPEKIMEHRIKLVVYAIQIDRSKTQFVIEGYLHGDLPVGLKPGKYKLNFNRFCICDILPDEMLESEEEVVISASELFDSTPL